MGFEVIFFSSAQAQNARRVLFPSLRASVADASHSSSTPPAAKEAERASGFVGRSGDRVRGLRWAADAPASSLSCEKSRLGLALSRNQQQRPPRGCVATPWPEEAHGGDDEGGAALSASDTGGLLPPRLLAWVSAVTSRESRGGRKGTEVRLGSRKLLLSHLRRFFPVRIKRRSF